MPIINRTTHRILCKQLARILLRDSRYKARLLGARARRKARRTTVNGVLLISITSMVILVRFGKTGLYMLLVVAVLLDVGLPRRHLVLSQLLRLWLLLHRGCLLGEVGLLAHDHIVEDGAMVVQRRLLLVLMAAHYLGSLLLVLMVLSHC